MICFENGAKILFTGDSVTDAGRARPVGEAIGGLGEGYVKQTAVLLSCLYPEKQYCIVNTGTSGNTSRDLLARFDSEALALNPDWILCMIGVNDVWRQFDRPWKPEDAVDLPEFSRNVAEIIDRTVAAGKRIVMLLPFFVESIKTEPMRARVIEYANAAKRICEAKGVGYIDLQAGIDEYLKQVHPMYLTWDRVHPGPVAAMLIAREILRGVGCDRPLL